MKTSARIALLTASLTVTLLAAPAIPVQAAPSGASAAETASLMTIYDNMDGANWADNTNWDNGGDPCAAGVMWYGVGCDGAGNIAGLDLSYNDLDGDIGDIDLSGLTNLQDLFLEGNSITGDIADLDLSGLIDLDYLILSDNLISGDIGGLDLTGLGNLQFLVLESNQISGDIGGLDLTGLGSLLILYLGDNQIGGNIGGLDLTGAGSLLELDLWDNQIGGDIGNLDLSPSPFLYYVDLDSNQIGGNIGGLDLSGNSNLEELYLGDNQIGGDIGNLDLTGAASLLGLDLWDNQIGGLIDNLDLSGAPNLEYFDVYSNQIGGDIGNLTLTGTPIYYLDLGDNQIGGDISNLDLSSVPDLEELYLDDNQMTGDPSASDFPTLSWLYVLFIADNQLNGTVPDLTGTDIDWGAVALCGTGNIVAPSGNAGIDTYAETYDITSWTAASGCPATLIASVRCDVDDLEIRILEGDGPFDVTGTGTQLPILGTGLMINDPALDGPGEWTGVTISETGGDLETIAFGDFDCERNNASTGSSAAPVVTVEPSVRGDRGRGGAQIILNGALSQTAAAPGDILTWTFTVENRGTAPSDPLSFSAILPDQLADVTVETTQGAVVTSGPPTTIVDLDSIPPGGIVTITINGTWAGEAPRQGGEARQGVRARVMPGAANQEVGEEVCVTGMVADQSLDVCLTNFPAALPATGGEPVELLRWFVIAILAAALTIGAGAWFMVRQKPAA
ncbi:MAG: hypothetical protein JXJ17_17290 [Anaerolineae bacterium]|nr:hypothetical protein [Anaerolineae bacterium]